MKTCLITGASRGIGRATARLFAARGYHVIINYHQSEDRARSLAEEITAAGGSCSIFRADVADPGEARALAEHALQATGRLDVLVNNAAVAAAGLFTDVRFDEWSRLFAVDVGGAFNVTSAVLPAMIHEKSGSIVNISSIWGITGASCEVHYSAAKAALIGFTKALAQEVGPSGIRVNCVAPGVVNTEMNAALTPDDLAALCDETPLGRIAEPAEIAESVWFLCSDAAAFITGQVVSPNGGIVI